MDEEGLEVPLDFEEALEQAYDLDDPLVMAERVFQLMNQWSDIHIYVVSPHIPPISPPLILSPEFINEDELEFVYPIIDSGFKLSASRAEDMYAHSSFCKMHYTIEKMVALLIERLKSGGVDAEAEVQVAFAGSELLKRKAFESIINLVENVVVTNFEPGEWGEKYLKTVKVMADKGYGYPPESPRENYRKSHNSNLKLGG